MKYNFFHSKKNVVIFLLLLPFHLWSQPTGYYNGTEGLSGAALKSALHNIINDHYFNENWYHDVKYLFLLSDADTAHQGNVIDVYSGNSMDGLNYGTQEGSLNREHVWAKSHGGFPEASPMYSDYHNLKPCEARINRDKSNLDFDWGGLPHPTATGCFYDSDSWEPRDAVKGDIARIIFYMATRYEGGSGEQDLEVVDWVNTYPMPKHGKLSALFAWNVSDPPDDFERNRNNVIYAAQRNRNPFIDNPEWINMIWGTIVPNATTIGNIQQTPILPSQQDPVTISCTIDNLSNGSTVHILWGFSYTELNNNTAMTQNGNCWSGIIPAQTPSKIYYTIQVNNNGETITSVCYNYLIANTIPIADIQGSNSTSPYLNQTVQTYGIVTAPFQNGFYIQDNTDIRSGIFIYDHTHKPAAGNLVMIEGIVHEYFNLTEISNLSNYLLLQNSSSLPMIYPIPISANNIGNDYESMLVHVEGICTQLATNNYWKIHDGTGEISIHNNPHYSITPAINQSYSVNGILTVSNYGWFVELYDYTVNINEQDINSHSISLFPNPASNLIFLNTSINIEKIEIYDIIGKHLKTIKCNPSNSNRFDISFLPSGVWLMKIYGQNNTFVKKFIKK